MLWRKKLPKLYSEKEAGEIENHINSHFGKFDNVLHEIVSPDIHVDICVTNPTPERNYYTLVTMGMGAHQMNVPYYFRQEASVCTLSNGDKVNFYQVIALHENEMNFKIANSAEALKGLFPVERDMVLDVARKSVVQCA